MNPVLLAAAFALAAPVPRDADKKADYFPLRKGTACAFRVTDGQATHDLSIEVTAAEAKGGRTVSTLKYSGGSVEELAFDAAGVYRPGADGTFDKPVVVLRYPLTAGATWESALPLGSDSVAATATVEGVVEVEVPAGKYKAVCVRFVGPAADGGPATTISAWYADGVGVVKQVFDHGNGNTSTLELMKFTPGK